MANRTKGLTGALLAAALWLLCAGGAWAADPDTDSLTITLTPSVDLGVDVDTATTRFNATDSPGTMSTALADGATGYFISPATVTVLGNFNNQEVQLQAAGLNDWTVDADENANSDAVQLYGMFSVNKTSRPVELEFGADSGRHLITGSAQTAGETQGSESNLRTSNRYEIANGDMAGGAANNMDNLAVGDVRQLWLRVDAPPQSGYSGDQRFQVTVTAVSGVLN